MSASARCSTYPTAKPPTLYKPVGCDNCKRTGYRGRTGIYEMVMVDDELRAKIHDGSGEQELEKYARTMTPSIRDDGKRLVLAGITSVEEVLRVTREG